MASTSVTRWERLYFAAVGVLALWVGVWGFFVPLRVARAIPFTVPPLHARFLGAMYLSGATFMVGSIVSRRWEEVRPIPLLTAVWTGGLGVVSLFHLSAFPFERIQTWIWFGAYSVYPAIGLWLAFRHRGDAGPAEGAPLAGWARAYLRAQGTILTVLGALLLLLPGTMAGHWPWPITSLLAQIYAAPFLAYGVASLLISRRRTWGEVRVGVTGMAVFAVGVLVASKIHRALFSIRQVQDVAWFAFFAVASVALVLLAVRSRARARS